ncbi:MAG TPA: hypothetical protein VG435_11495 [Acidimicrobiales bacterium]|jgi:hypothetical protein|nr:hypothetical protein [Acidimicrobiales bacterium]
MKRHAVVLPFVLSGASMLAVGCGSSHSAAVHPLPPVSVSIPPATTTVISPTSVMSKEPAVTTTAPPANPAGPAAAINDSDLSAIQSDLNSVDGADNQSSSDFNAGTSAQAQNDNP